MKPKLTISLFQISPHRLQSFLIWRNTSGMPLPILPAEPRYGLEVVNGPRWIYGCQAVSKDYLLTRLLEFLDHDPNQQFTDCRKCQVRMALGLEPEPTQPDPDPVIRELEYLNTVSDQWLRTTTYPQATATLTRDELKTTEDKCVELVDSWTDFEAATILYLIITRRSIDRDRAREIRRAEEAKVKS